MTQPHLLLIDSSSFAYRAHFAPGIDLRTKDGMPTKAVLGFAAMVWRMMGRAGEGDPPTYAAAVFDYPAKTFRHKAFKDYKGQRKRPADLEQQLPLMRQASDVLGLNVIEVKGFEADDVIASLAHIGRAQGIRSTIVSIDKDLCQMVIDGHIEMVDPFNRKRMLEADIKKKFGVPPHLMQHWQALCGDAVDNIPGVPMIGPKTAAELINAFGEIEDVLKAANDLTERRISNQVRHHINKERKNIPLYLKLTTLHTGVFCGWKGPHQFDFETLRPKLSPRSLLKDFLDALDAGDALNRIFPERPGISGGRIVFRAVEPIPSGTSQDWWTRELDKPGQPVPEIPQCGYYKRRLLRGGPWVAVRIWREPHVDRETGVRSGQDKLLCTVNGERTDALAQWGYVCAMPISESEFSKLGKVKKPREKVDHLRTPIT